MIFNDLPIGKKFKILYEQNFIQFMLNNMKYPESKQQKLYPDNTYVKVNDIQYKCVDNPRIRIGYLYKNVEVELML